MSLLDDLLRLFGTNRTRLKWRLERLKKESERKKQSVANAAKPLAYEHQLCPGCGHPAGKDESVCTRCGVKLRGAVVAKAGRVLSGFLPEDAPVVSMVFLAICVALYAVTLKVSYDTNFDMEGTSPTNTTLLAYGANHPYYTLMLGGWWRGVTATFLHGSLMHLAMNGFAMWTAGRVIEERFGAARSLVLLVVTGALGHLFSAWVRLKFDAPPWPVSIGASSAGFGQLGFVIAYALRHRGPTTADLRERFIPWALYGLIMTFAISNIDKMAHLGGMAVGMLMGVLVADKRTARRVPAAVWNVFALLAVAIVVVAFAYASQYKPDPVLG